MDSFFELREIPVGLKIQDLKRSWAAGGLKNNSAFTFHISQAIESAQVPIN
jgi:hypothetical protein